jgi:LAO/AO transport system kinase
LHPKIIEITDLIKAAGYDHIIIETVGVGQSEIEIAGLADVTVVVMVPESGDEVQIMKAGVMEIADIIVINKSDRPGSEVLEKSLLTMLAPVFSNNTNEIFVLKTVASENKGIEELKEKILLHLSSMTSERKNQHFAEKAFYLIQNKRMKDVNKKLLKEMISSEENFNLYKFLSKHF